MTPKQGAPTSASAESAKRLGNHRATIEDYIEYLKPNLGLSDWRIDLMDDAPTDNSHSAQAFIRTGSDYAKIWVSDDFLTNYSNQERTLTLIHELVHCHLERPWQFFEDLAKAELGEQAKNIAQHVFRGHMELAIERLTVVLANYVDHIDLDS